MAETITLEVVTPQRQLVSEPVSRIQLPGRDGYLGILPRHAPLLTELGVGELSYHTASGTRYLSVARGFAEVLGERVIVLAEIAERAEEIDVKRAQAARDRAAGRLARTGATEVDWDRATFALERSLIRLQVAAKGGAVAAAAEEHHAAP